MGRVSLFPKYRTRQARRREAGLKRCGMIRPPRTVVVDEDPRTKKVKVYGAKPLNTKRLGNIEYESVYRGHGSICLDFNSVTPNPSHWKIYKEPGGTIILADQGFCLIGIQYRSWIATPRVVILQTFPVYDAEGSDYTLYLPDELDVLAYDSNIQWCRSLGIMREKIIASTTLRNTTLFVFGESSLRGEACLYEKSGLQLYDDQPLLGGLSLYNDSWVRGKSIEGRSLKAHTCCEIALDECTADCTKISAEASCTVNVGKGAQYRLGKPLLASSVTFNGIRESDA